MHGTQNVLFGGLPLNVSVSAPVLNAGANASAQTGCGTPTTPVTGADACGCVVQPGNGIAAIHQGQNPFPAVALAPLAAFCAVVFGVGGVKLADVGVPANRDVVVGIVTNSPLVGQLATVAWGGPVVNTLLGTGGWNFVLNQPVYIGADGVITQTAPTVGWVKEIGIAIASNTIMLNLVEAAGSSTPGVPLVSVVPTSANLVLDHDAADVFDVTLADPTTLDFTGGIDGRSVTLRIKQDSIGGNSLTLASGHFVGTITVPGTANAYVQATVGFDGATGKYVITNVVNLT